MCRTLSCAVPRCTLLLLGIFIASASVRAATPEEVEQAIDRGKTFLYEQQRNGTWEPGGGDVPGGVSFRGSYSALVTYALLAAGEPPQDPRLKGAIDYLLKE